MSYKQEKNWLVIREVRERKQKTNDKNSELALYLNKSEELVEIVFVSVHQP